jgi:hypothetical protein
MHSTPVDRSRENEERFAQANEQIKDMAEDFSVEPVPFLCECSSLRCMEIVPVPLDTYRGVREQGRFVLSPGHDDPHVESIVKDCGIYVVVEKFA